MMAIGHFFLGYSLVLIYLIATGNYATVNRDTLLAVIGGARV